MRKVFSGALAALFLAPQSLMAHDRPLGDGKISAKPAVGYLMSCQQSFNSNAPGAFATGPWIKGDRYHPAEKPVVDGNVRWPSEISVERRGDKRVVRANNLPKHPTGAFPIGRNDDAYRYDRNPNRIRDQDVVLELPADPKVVAAASCVPMGMIGFTLSGVALYNAVDARGMDAPAYEIQDSCGGHPQQQGQYHYHDRSPCLEDTRSETGGHSDLVGYALDGFGVYGIYGEGGKALTNTDLDGCHGHTHEVDWDGERKKIYHYHLTDEYPYSIGCFRGAPVSTPFSFAGPPR